MIVQTRYCLSVVYTLLSPGSEVYRLEVYRFEVYRLEVYRFEVNK